jgi:hypothetical protein
VGGDTNANLLKNRIDAPAHTRDFSVHQFLHLSWPGDVSQETTPMARWTKRQRQQIFRYEGMGAGLVGYLVSFDHTGPAEPTNCMGRAGSDWHLWIATKPHASRKSSVITEATPRVRAREGHFDWKTLTALSKRSAKVRVTGWIFFDNDHPVRESDRSTLWEIHPITRVDVWRKGHWIKVAGR